MKTTMLASGLVNGAQIEVTGSGEVEADARQFQVRLELAAGAPMWDPILLAPIWLDAIALAGPLDDGVAEETDPVPAAIHARQDLLDEDGRLVGMLRAAVEVQYREAGSACRIHVLEAECQLELGELATAIDGGGRAPMLATGANGLASISAWTARTGRGRTLVALTAAHVACVAATPHVVPTRALSLTRGETGITLAVAPRT